MEKGIFVKDFAPGQQVEGHFVVAGAKCGTASNGKTYWSVELQDATGKADAKIWDPLSSRIADLPGNTVLWLRGGVTQFNNRLQVRIEDVRVLDDEERATTDVRWFVPSSPRDVDEMEAELRDICAREFTHPTWRDFAREILNDGEIAMALRIFPAAKSMHHAYAGGLLEHTLGVCRLCLAMSDSYPELDRQTLLAGALCHDLGKIREFSAGLTTDYTDDGRLMGHIIQGLAMLEPIFERSGLEDGLRQHLTHLILSHHGLLEHGAVQVPQTAEAIALHHADNVDAKLAMCRDLTAKMDEESNWTEYHRGMGHAIFQPMRTPVSAHVGAQVAPEAACQTPSVEEAEPAPEAETEDVVPWAQADVASQPEYEADPQMQGGEEATPEFESQREPEPETMSQSAPTPEAEPQTQPEPEQQTGQAAVPEEPVAPAPDDAAPADGAAAAPAAAQDGKPAHKKHAPSVQTLNLLSM